MVPNREKIEKAAYDRWERRGYRHGFDRQDWVAAEKDLVFALNYRWVARHSLATTAPTAPGPAAFPKGRWRRCRFCEQAEPLASFRAGRSVLPGFLAGISPVIRDECDDCRAHFEDTLDAPFESFARPWVARPGALGLAHSIPVAALKGLVRVGLSVMPDDELHHFGDTVEWLANSDHRREAALARSAGLGCEVYVTPEPLPSNFLSLARRHSDRSAFPYMLVFLGVARVVFQARLPMSPRDEDLPEEDARGPVVSMSLGRGDTFRESISRFLPVEVFTTAARPRAGSRSLMAGAGVSTNG